MNTSSAPTNGGAEVQQSLDLGPSYAKAQRWFKGRDSYRPTREPIRTAEFTVEPLDKTKAKTFVETHHYSGSFVYEVASFGLWHKQPLQPARLVGVASFATPSNPNSIQRWTGLTDYRLGVELGRFVLLDEVAGNGETFFLARALKGLKALRPELRVVLSYSDPTPRLDLDTGRLRFIGHYGSIYQSSNALYLGRASAKTLLLTRNGEAIPNRILTKARNQEAGAQAALDRLADYARIEPSVNESPEDFVTRVLQSPLIRKARHPGNHLYLFPLAENRREKQQILRFPVLQAHLGKNLPYPKILDQAA